MSFRTDLLEADAERVGEAFDVIRVEVLDLMGRVAALEADGLARGYVPPPAPAIAIEDA